MEEAWYTKNNDTLHFNQISDEEKCFVAQWVPHMLFPTQKQYRVELCQKYLTCYKKQGVPFLQRIIAINETHVRDFETELYRYDCRIVVQWTSKCTYQGRSLLYKLLFLESSLY